MFMAALVLLLVKLKWLHLSKITKIGWERHDAIELPTVHDTFQLQQLAQHAAH